MSEAEETVSDLKDPFRVLSSEQGVVRVFATELEPEGAAAITAGNVHKLLGKDIELDPTKVEVFPAKVIQALGLAAYLYEGYGIAEDDLRGKRSALDALTDLIVLIPSSAFKGKALDLDPNPALRFIGAFREPAKAPPAPMPEPESAKGALTPSKQVETVHHRQRKGSWIIALGALIIAAALVLFAVF